MGQAQDTCIVQRMDRMMGTTLRSSGSDGPKNQNSRNCSIMAHVGKTLVSFSRWRQQLERSIHFASLLHVWWERSSGTWHAALNVNRTTWLRGPFRWSFPPHKSVNKGQKHIAAHALRACSARSLSAFALRSSIHSSGLNLSSTPAPAYIYQNSTNGAG